jgi:hypothetical protein
MPGGLDGGGVTVPRVGTHHLGQRAVLDSEHLLSRLERTQLPLCAKIST